MGRPRGQSLALPDVIAAGRRIVEAHGASQLTLSSVARALGIKPPSLCHHVESTEELRVQVALSCWLALARALSTACLARSGRERLLAYASGLRGFARAEPAVFELMMEVSVPHARIVESGLARALLGPLFESFGELGLSGAALIHAVRALRAAVTGFALLECHEQFQMDAPADQSFETLLAALLDGLTAREPVRGLERGLKGKRRRRPAARAG